ncbi:hypothetical protein CEXT_68961 [Caerostris extrusa]|uniref:Uncharacterized protein n=1 Tax=Caerostris extrusa TaxID=172846 RepID=A0AAV4TGF1_CAEEX|nr:hypothetical protein CEXT_68961 [Caerostris extrusa]
MPCILFRVVRRVRQPAPATDLSASTPSASSQTSPGRRSSSSTRDSSSSLQHPMSRIFLRCSKKRAPDEIVHNLPTIPVKGIKSAKR